MQTYKSQSNHRPPEWDTESSPTTVYHNYDIKEITDENGTHFEYMVDKMNDREFNRALIGKVVELEKKAEVFKS